MSLKFDKQILEDVLKRRHIIIPSFSIYGGQSGLYDLGPVAASVFNNIQAEWRKHFLVYDNIQEINCPALTPYSVLKASGHVDKFSDTLVRDMVNHTSYRTDKLIEEFIENNKTKLLKDFSESELNMTLITAGSMTIPELQDTIAKYKILSPDNNPLSEIRDFNLMFETKIGPDANAQAFMRPETAQGIFVNFKSMKDFNNSKLPFGVAQVGNGYRNEIAPRNGLLRVREFPMAEIEWFVDPTDKNYKKYHLFSNVELPLYSKALQLANSKPQMEDMTQAVENRLISNSTLAYFMIKTYLFLQKIGIGKENIRFRQHLDTEMAHYACDCWDAEIFTSYGWIECVGHADRACFDLDCHMKSSGQDMQMSRKLDQPKVFDKYFEKFEKGLMGKEFKKDCQLIIKHITESDDSAKQEFDRLLKEDKDFTVEVNGKPYTLNKKYLSFEVKEVKIHEEKFLPHVIEPSFGMGRILYSVLENTFNVRPNQTYVKGEALRTYFHFPMLVSPIKVGIFPLQNDDKFTEYVEQLEHMCKEQGWTTKVESSGVALGKRYSRLDELGVSLGITVDYETLDDKMVTLRDVHTCKQIRVLIADLTTVLSDLLGNRTQFQNLIEKYGEYDRKTEE